MSSVIPKQPKKDRDQITIKLDRDVLENLERYCEYLDSSRDYVINQCLVFIFRRDRPFTEWLASQGAASDVSTEALEPSPSKPAIRRPARSHPAQGQLAITE